jgi:hypothetical protein
VAGFIANQKGALARLARLFGVKATWLAKANKSIWRAAA